MSTSLPKPRIEWIDLAKGISIVLVAYGHSGLNSVPFAGLWFVAFRMPFFFVSGLLFSGAKYASVKPFMARRWKTLYRPYFIFSLLLAAGLWAKDGAAAGPFVRDCILTGWGGYALWFIPVLTLTELLFFFLSRRRWASPGRLLVALVGLAALGRGAYLLGLPNPYNLWFVLTSVGFYGLGSIMKGRVISLSRRPLGVLVGVLVLMFALSCCFLFEERRPEFAVNDLGELWMYPAALFGTLFMCVAAMVGEHVRWAPAAAVKRLIIYLGKNSYIVLAFHQIVLQLLGRTGLFPWGSLQRVAMWLLLLLLIYLINHYCPWVIGRQRPCQTKAAR